MQTEAVDVCRPPFDIYVILIKLKYYYFKNLLRLPPYNHNNQGVYHKEEKWKRNNFRVLRD